MGIASTRWEWKMNERTKKKKKTTTTRNKIWQQPFGIVMVRMGFDADRRIETFSCWTEEKKWNENLTLFMEFSLSPSLSYSLSVAFWFSSSSAQPIESFQVQSNPPRFGVWIVFFFLFHSRKNRNSIWFLKKSHEIWLIFFVLKCPLQNFHYFIISWAEVKIKEVFSFINFQDIIFVFICSHDFSFLLPFNCHQYVLSQSNSFPLKMSIVKKEEDEMQLKIGTRWKIIGCLTPKWSLCVGRA